MGSKCPASALPYRRSAAIDSSTDWVEILIVGTAILSPGRKSPSALMRGSRLISTSGSAQVATMPFTRPLVRSHSSSMLPTPVLTRSTLSASSASVAAPPPLKVFHSTVTPGSPSLAAWVSISPRASMM